MTVRNAQEPERSDALRSTLEADGRRVIYAADEAEALQLLSQRDAAGVDKGDLVVVIAPARGERSAGRREQVLGERDAQASEERLRTVIDAVPHLIWVLNTNGDLVYGNRRWRDYLGREDLPASAWHEIIHPDDFEPLPAMFSEASLPGSPGNNVELRVRGKDGHYRWFTSRTVPVRDATGQLLYFVGTSTDLDDLKRAQRAAESNYARFRELAEAIPHLVWEIDASGCLAYANRRFHDYFGKATLTPTDYATLVHPEDIARVLHQQQQCGGELGREQAVEARLRQKDGSYRWFSTRWIAMLDELGKVSRVVGTSTDIDNLKQAERLLRESQEQLQVAISASHIGLWNWEIKTNRVSFSDEWKRQLGYEPHEMGGDFSEWEERLHPDEAESALARVRSYLEKPWPNYQNELRLRHKDGSYRWILTHASVVRDERGAPERMVGCHIDITENKRLEEELRQAQKMEAVGRLAGGVAHDFNNLLTVILGQTSLAERRKDIPEDLRTSLRDIGQAAERAASLTAQLLAFGRKQIMQARTLDLNDVVAETTKMLERVLGEDISLLFAPCDDAALVHADPNQLVQVLLNLAVNARDAMPRGGRLCLRTRRGKVEQAKQAPILGAGEWVWLEVEDSGSGISPEILPRIFEPFFTTKELGKGTGLGLATVYGIVRQHGGDITVESGGQGSTFRVYLPAAQPELAPVDDQAPGELALSTGSERIVLVEDDPHVRAVLQRILVDSGYRVDIACTAAEALHVLELHAARVDLVLTDVVMPQGMSGGELAAVLRASYPHIKILLTSGYSTDVVHTRAVAELGVRFLQKPYSAEQLLNEVRAVLDLPAGRVSPLPGRLTPVR